jgi:hypothetical protein
MTDTPRTDLRLKCRDCDFRHVEMAELLRHREKMHEPKPATPRKTAAE